MPWLTELVGMAAWLTKQRFVGAMFQACSDEKFLDNCDRFLDFKMQQHLGLL